MKSPANADINPRRWRQFLEEVNHALIVQGLGTSQASNLDDLTRLIQQGTGLSKSRSEREVNELFHSFEEKIRRAA